MPAGNYLGQVLTGQSYHWVIIPIGMLIGYFIVKAEPAVYVLNKQVEEVTDGAISAQAMGMALSAGVSISVGLAMVRVLTGISILWFLIPGYAVAIGISFVVPKLFTAIAFDAGGVASGPMTPPSCCRWHREPAWPWAATSLRTPLAWWPWWP